MEELGGQSRVGLDLEDLSNEVGGDPAKLLELLHERRTPLTTVLPEGIDDEASNGGEEGQRGGGGSGRWRRWSEVRVPIGEVEGLGWLVGLGLGRRWHGDTVREEAAADDWAVLGRLAMAMEEVESVRLRWRGLWRHFYSLSLSQSLYFLAELLQGAKFSG